MFKNIQGKLVFLYFCLVLIIMIIVGYFLIDSIKIYMYEDYLGRVDRLVSQKANHKLASYKDIKRFARTGELSSVVSGDFEYYSILSPNGKVLTTIDSEVKIGQTLSSKAIRSAMRKKKSSIDGRTAINNNYIEYASPIYVSDNKNDWYILYVRESVEKDNGIIQKIIGYILKATIAALILSITLGFVLAKTITSPIKDLTLRAKEIASGKFERRIRVKSNDEIGQLTLTFNHMAGQLKRNLDELSSQKTKVETILKNLADGVVAFDIDGDIIHVNHVAKNMLRSVNREVWNGGFEELFSCLDINIEYSQIFSLLEDDKIVKLWEHDNSIVKIYISPFSDEFGNVFGSVAVFQDITEQTKLDNMRKEFVANVSHELRTPITTVKSYSETLLDGALEEREIAQEFLGVINSEADRMTRLISDLLELSRYDYKYAKLVISKFNINELIRISISKVLKLANDKNQNISSEIGNEGIEIEGDRDRLEQVIINILSNAIKYTRENGDILVKLSKTEEDVIISVKDSGIGIPKEDISRIFERFYRVDKARSRAMGGTGLGLSIVKEIVDAHGGSIDVISEVGNGTEMVVKIPINVPLTGMDG